MGCARVFATTEGDQPDSRNANDVAADTREDEHFDGDTRIAPDPFAAVLPGIAALGAIASIAAINWMAQDKTKDRPKLRRKAGMALWREHLFVWMSHLAAKASDYFRIPSNRVVELGTQVEI